LTWITPDSSVAGASWDGTIPNIGILSLSVVPASAGGGRVSVSSWIGSVWSHRGEKGPVIGQVHAVEGSFVTLSVVGIEGQQLEDVEVVGTSAPGVHLARVTSASLLGRWKRMGGEAA
jgi:hypothetical protein